jgi:hypothetical protein
MKLEVKRVSADNLRIQVSFHTWNDVRRRCSFDAWNYDVTKLFNQLDRKIEPIIEFQLRQQIWGQANFERMRIEWNEP